MVTQRELCCARSIFPTSRARPQPRVSDTSVAAHMSCPRVLSLLIFDLWLASCAPRSGEPDVWWRELAHEVLQPFVTDATSEFADYNEQTLRTLAEKTGGKILII